MTELVRRYVVMPLATEAPFDPADPDGVFVLKPWKDPAALSALRAYRDGCFPELRRDLDAWIRVIESGPTVRGDVGRRNEPFARAAAARGLDEPADAARTRATASTAVKQKTPRAASAAKSPKPSTTPKRMTGSKASTGAPVARTAKTARAGTPPVAKTASATRRAAASSGRTRGRAERRAEPKDPVRKRRR